MKTYVLTVSKNFPMTHPRRGESTGFVEAIMDLRQYKEATKIHTIRANYPLWEKRVKEINDGKARLSIRYWTGKPYNSKQEEILCLTRVGVQKLRWLTSCTAQIRDNYHVVTDVQLASNDGLSIQDFKDWFRGYDLSRPMAIIHFTIFRY
jgi:hypothetical protein